MNWPFYYALIALLVLQLVLSWWIRRTKLGMGLMAIRGDETKAATIGINLPVNKIIGFVASSVVVGMAGAVYGYYLTFIDPRGMFGILLSVQIVLVGAGRRKWNVVGADCGRVHHRAPQRGGQQQLRRRKRAVVPVRRPAHGDRDLAAAGDPPGRGADVAASTHRRAGRTRGCADRAWRDAYEAVDLDPGGARRSTRSVPCCGSAA